MDRLEAKKFTRAKKVFRVVSVLTAHGFWMDLIVFFCLLFLWIVNKNRNLYSPPAVATVLFYLAFQVHHNPNPNPNPNPHPNPNPNPNRNPYPNPHPSPNRNLYLNPNPNPNFTLTLTLTLILTLILTLTHVLILTRRNLTPNLDQPRSKPTRGLLRALNSCPI